MDLEIQQFSLYSDVTVDVIFDDGDEDSPTLIDPTAVILWIVNPDGVESSYQYLVVGSPIIRESLGTYYANINVDKSGYWHYAWRGTGNLNALHEGKFYVRRVRADIVNLP